MQRTLYIDIETAPITAHAWGLWQQNVGLSQIMQDPRVLCFAAKWRGEKRVLFFSEWKDGRVPMLEAAHRLMSEADVIVHFNGISFDTKWLNGEFYREDMSRPAPFKQLDLMRVVKKNFRFPSNKLAYIAELSGIGQKVSHEGHALWVKCMEGQERAQRRMERYCKQDTKLLEPLHERLTPWITGHPSVALFDDIEGPACPQCGGDDLRREGFYYTQVSKYQRYQCRTCGVWSHSGKRASGTDLRGTS